MTCYCLVVLLNRGKFTLFHHSIYYRNHISLFQFHSRYLSNKTKSLDDLLHTEPSLDIQTNTDIILPLTENIFDEEHQNTTKHNSNLVTKNKTETEIERNFQLTPTNHQLIQDSKNAIIRYPTFTSMNLRKKLHHSLVNNHQLCPLPIQSLSYPKIQQYTKQHSISASIIQSSMGSGKTLAYLLPALNNLNPQICNQIIIITPSTELTLQVKATIISYLSSSKTSTNTIQYYTLAVCDHSSCSNISIDYYSEIIKYLKPCIIIGTPKHIHKLFLNEILNTHNIQYLIYDEIDILFTIKSKYENIKNKHKTKYNTIHKPSELLLNGILKQKTSEDEHNFHVMFVGSTLPSMLKYYIQRMIHPYPVQYLGVDNRVYISPNIYHQFVNYGSRVKEKVVAQIVQHIRNQHQNGENINKPGVLIVVKRGESPLTLAEKLATYDLKVALLHEYMGDTQLRSKFLRMFKNGNIDAVIGSEITAGRGLDFLWLDHVILYNIPRQAVNYIHIAGRTGRLNSVGFITSVVDDEDEYNLKRHCFKLQIELHELSTDIQCLKELGGQYRVYNKSNTFPLLLESNGYQQKFIEYKARKKVERLKNKNEPLGIAGEWAGKEDCL